ncbi:MAG: ATP-binding protein [Candidatus Omnitrophica bacterium]|nr:ATP-binding protein [Candidatus Omnitrophota bacterium]
MATGLNKGNKNLSFKIKLIFSYFLIILVLLGFVAFFLNRNLEANLLYDTKASLISQARLVESQIPSESLKKEDAADLRTLVKEWRPKIDCRITIIGNEGKVLIDSERSREETLCMENHLNRPEVKQALNGTMGVDIRYSSTLKIKMLYVALPLKDKDGTIGTLRLALPLESARRTLFAARKIIFMGLFFALGLAIILGSILASQTIRPINNMIRVSRKFAEGDFSRKMIRNSGDEIGELAVALNKMAEDIENKIREVKAQNQKFATILSSMIEGVIVVDKTGCIISINPAIEKVFGVLDKDVEGKLFLEAIRNNDISDIISAVLKRGGSDSSELSLVWPVHGVFQVNAAPIFDGDKINGCLLVIHDITEVRRLEIMRRDFIANVSHELKTPLTSIKGFVETLLEGALEDKEHNRDFLRIIQDHAERLDNLVNDLLSLSYLEAEETEISKKDFNLWRQAEDVIQGFKTQLKKKNIKIKNELPINLSIKADKNKIEQVFTNFIDNAIKFNKENGYIKIYGQETKDNMKIIVEDSGFGIPEKDIPLIFERFYRVDKARSRELGGTGLGLSIVKHIVELHKGNVGVESTEGLGSKFWFILPK